MFDKIPFHQILALFTLFCVSLTACAPAPVPTPTATMLVETPKPSATATASATPTETPTPEPTEAPVPQYELSTLPEFKDLGIPVYEIPAEDHFNGNFQTFLDANSEPFDPTKVVVMPLTAFTNQDGTSFSYVKYKDDAYKNWPSPETRSFRKSQIIGHTVSGIYEYLVLPVEFIFPDGTSSWVDTVYMIKISEGKNKSEVSSRQIVRILHDWFSSPKLYLSLKPCAGLSQDLVAESQMLYPPAKLTEMAKQFANTLDTKGDPTKISELSKKGVVLSAFIPTQ